MAHNPLTLSRRHVLGDLYSRCDRLVEIPIYWSDPAGPPIGYVDERDGRYSDSFTFHMGEEFCRKLAGGQLLCRFNYEYSDESDASAKSKRRLRLTSFVLTAPVINQPQMQAQMNLGTSEILTNGVSGFAELTDPVDILSRPK